MKWSEQIAQLGTTLRSLQVSGADGEPIASDLAFESWASHAERVRSEDRTVYFVGNGASASMASHFAADLAKNGQMHTQTFTDPALMTALGNDLGYDKVYSEPLRRRARLGDMLVAISSSGKSPNILSAVETAQELGSMVVSLSAMGADNPLRASGMLNFYVAAETYGSAETSHAAILHHWMDAVASA